MLSANRFFPTFMTTAFVLVMLASFGMSIRAQDAPPVHVGNTKITGLPDDWTHHRVIFSDPGKEEDAIRNGTHERWLKIVNDPRYVIQQLKRGSTVQGPAGQDVDMRRRIGDQDFKTWDPWKRHHHEDPKPDSAVVGALKRDWSMELGGAAVALAGQYPAKYNFSTTSATCSDYVAFPTGAAGSATQATIVAYNNLYDTTCGTAATRPGVAWAYNTGGTAALSPVLSLDGTQVAYIQTSASVASLVLLKWANTPATITTATGSVSSSSTSVTATTGITAADVGMQITDTSRAGCIPAGDTVAAFSGTTVTLATATSGTCGTHAGDSLTLTAETVVVPGVPALAASGAAYRTCTAPCDYKIILNGSHNDTISAPYYRYDNSDILYVGDSSGNLHEFTGVFVGTPAETISATHWPISVSANVLTSPTFDFGTNFVFVADSGGILYSYNPTATPTAEMKSSRLTNASNTTGIIDSPVIDSSAGKVYVAVGDDANTDTSGNYTCLVAAGCTGLFQFATNSTTIGTGACAASGANPGAWPGGSNCGQEAIFGTGSYPNMYNGDFDNTYYTGTGTTGYIWECSPSDTGGTVIGPRLNAVVMQSDGGIVPTGDVIFYTGNVLTVINSLSSNGAGTCSPVTEFYNTGNASAVTTYSGTIAATGATATITVASNSNIAIGNYIQIDTEIMLVTGTTGLTSITVARPEIGTTEAGHTGPGNITIPAVDYIYLSVTALGNKVPSALNCSGACLYSFGVGSAIAGAYHGFTVPTNGIAETGGTSGVVIDNAATAAGESQIYYTTLGAQGCVGNGTTGSGTGGCAVQTSQSAP